MIKVSVMYPNGKDVKFDKEYYQNIHLPMVLKTVGDAIKELELDFGIVGRVAGEPAPYVAIAHMKFEDIASFNSSFAPHAELLAADLKNYSNIKGELQISELKTF
ncbi:EthD family reductase [Brumimicrobium glaciale]|uniref:EthD family reductase n=1 Tax=Brumimicrobium glaciale TaxID=200475 RepID=A0A4V1WFN7_9FLAO|nr:EthD family reductase [Brumimicrobium glaciale]RYM33836.1 EthD family reductase [Brumimicrobium glaciale]